MGITGGKRKRKRGKWGGGGGGGGKGGGKGGAKSSPSPSLSGRATRSSTSGRRTAAAAAVAVEAAAPDTTRVPNRGRRRGRGGGRGGSKDAGDSIEPEPPAELCVADEARCRRQWAQMHLGGHAVREAALAAAEEKFEHWRYLLSCQFSVLLWGLGSKKTLLKRFAESELRDGSVVYLDGYDRPRGYSELDVENEIQTENEPVEITPRSIAAAIVALIRRPSKNVIDYAVANNNDKIEDAATIAKTSPTPIYIVANGIDSPSMRGQDVQAALLALLEGSSGTCRIIASVDHIYAPILWDQELFLRFKWVWEESPTFDPYQHESASADLLVGGKASALVRSLRAATIVLKSLNSNARTVFRILLDQQLKLLQELDDPDDLDKPKGLEKSHKDGASVSFAEVYNRCRNEFIVTSELTLKSHLTEFKDHDLVVAKRGADGQDMLQVPFKPEDLRKLAEDTTW